MAGFLYPAGLNLPLSVAAHHSLCHVFILSSEASLWRWHTVISTAVSWSNLCGRRRLHKDINTGKHGLLGSDTISGLFSKNKQQTIRG